MKKLLVTLLTIATLSFTACSNPSSPTTSGDSSASPSSATASSDNSAKAGQKDIIGYCMPNTTEPFLANLSNTVKEKFAADGVDVEIASANNDAATQISQIENFATMGAKVIIVMAVDPTSVGDAIKQAQEKGSKVMVAGGDTGTYDAIMHTDQQKDGELIANMATDWINKTFPNAAPQSIEVAVLESRDTPEANQRCDGIQEIATMCPAAKVVQTVGSVKEIESGQSAAENIFQSHPDLKVILSYNSNGALGVNGFAIKPNSPVKDLSKFATFSSDLTPEVLQAVIDSSSDKSVFRGVVKFGSNDLPGDTYTLVKKMLLGQPFDKDNADPLTAITPENAQQFVGQ